MGADKAALLIDGVPMAHRIAQIASEACSRVTVLGREPLPGLSFLLDREEGAGPLSALADFQPTSSLVFIAACDMPLFCAGIIEGFAQSIDEADDALIPSINSRPQPLCGLYRNSCWDVLRDSVRAGNRRVMEWLDAMHIHLIREAQILELGLDLDSIIAVNTPEELSELLSRRHDRIGG